MSECIINGFTITQGDDTNALGNSIVFTLQTDLDLIGYSAVFQVEQIQYKWDDITSKALNLVLTREQTQTLSSGMHYGALKIFDNNNLAVTIIRNIPIKVLPMAVDNTME